MNILYVDDALMVLKLIKTKFNKMLPNDSIDTVSTAKDAIELLQSKDYDVIFSDLDLDSDVNGLDVLSFAEDKNPKSKTCLVTGSLAKKVKTHDHLVIEKPFDISILGDIVENARRNKNV